MTKRELVLNPCPAFLALLLVFFASGCSDDEKAPGSTGSTSDASTESGGGRDPFNGDCTTARWANLSDACWSCLCSACAATLNACNESCTSIFECALEKKTLVNVSADIPCEVRATGTECVDPEAGSAVQPLINFDGCLIGAQKPSGFRACDTECAIPYPGDVCTRYPPP